MRRTVLDVKIDDISKEEALERVETWLTSKKDSLGSPAGGLQNDTKLVFTPGPEFLVTASKDKEFQNILNSGDLNLPDGFGLQLFGGVKNRIPGVDFMLALCELAAKNKWTVGMIGGPNTKPAAAKLKDKYPGLKITFAWDDPDPVSKIKKPIDILFVGLGHPKQERFLKRIVLFNIVKFRVGMGVGGSFDFISGVVPEPPKIFSKLGLKWLGRLISRPAYMLPKIYKAVILYPWLSLSRMLKRTGG